MESKCAKENRLFFGGNNPFLLRLQHSAGGENDGTHRPARFTGGRKIADDMLFGMRFYRCEISAEPLLGKQKFRGINDHDEKRMSSIRKHWKHCLQGMTNVVGRMYFQSGKSTFKGERSLDRQGVGQDQKKEGIRDSIRGERILVTASDF